MKYTFLFFLSVLCISCQKELNDVELSKIRKEEIALENVETKKPEFKGGEKELLKYISSKIENYGLKDDTCCKVVVKFNISIDGRIENVNILNGGICSFKQKIIDIFQGMPKWKPGTLNKEPTKCLIYYLHQRKKLLYHFPSKLFYTKNGSPRAVFRTFLPKYYLE